VYLFVGLHGSKRGSILRITFFLLLVHTLLFTQIASAADTDKRLTGALLKAIKTHDTASVKALASGDHPSIDNDYVLQEKIYEYLEAEKEREEKAKADALAAEKVAQQKAKADTIAQEQAKQKADAAAAKKQADNKVEPKANTSKAKVQTSTKQAASVTAAAAVTAKIAAEKKRKADAAKKAAAEKKRKDAAAKKAADKKKRDALAAKKARDAKAAKARKAKAAEKKRKADAAAAKKRAAAKKAQKKKVAPKKVTKKSTPTVKAVTPKVKVAPKAAVVAAPVVVATKPAAPLSVTAKELVGKWKQISSEKVITLLINADTSFVLEQIEDDGTLVIKGNWKQEENIFMLTIRKVQRNVHTRETNIHRIYKVDRISKHRLVLRDKRKRIAYDLKR